MKQTPRRPSLTNRSEARFLEGPQSRLQEFYFLLRVFSEFIKGFRTLHFVGPCVTVFGSARFKEGHIYYDMARKMGGAITDLGFTVMTGGGPGIMEAANRGAREAGGKSVGCNIILPEEQEPNEYLDKWIELDHFFIRKVLLVKYSYAFIVMPGGFGTMDELFETITLIQNKKIKDFPIILMGRDYWSDLFRFLVEMAEAGTISNNDLQLIKITDDPEEAVIHLRKYALEAFRLKHRKELKPAAIFKE